MHTVTTAIESRFQGIPDVALGGYVGGLLAGPNESGEVTLRRPVPLDRALSVERREDGSATLIDGAEVLAAWRPAAVDVEVPTAVTYEEALVAEARALQRSVEHRHPFPGCMVCGSERAEGDGLRVFAGPVPDRSVVAAPWVPHPAHAGADGVVRPELTWAVLDCPTIMALVYASPADSPERVVTARFAVSRHGPVRAGERHVVVGWVVGRDGKAYVTGGAVLSATGAVLAVARHVLVPVKWGVLLGVDGWRRGERG
ncbi:MAG TPA: hotdog fold domain-containing protein [Anaeromyxobacteraceae bacterium]|nr:hotdog fold domain-containing protein [Anaeromyxobacteraceae bacterium]